MAWVILGVAVVTEIIWALSLKWAAGKATLMAASVPIVLSFVNMGLLALAMRGISAGTAYAVWTGLGAVGVIIGGTILFGERISGVQAIFMALIVIGVVGTKLTAQA
ncbi:DMT family transporter [Sphingomonas baiyangensis]|uniref:Guanidinium exporter n=1 Tax=Sphingomonas baiyangensis TaxID=2572576 RepID=A0A4U1L353_9SPHN|nr:SMR family transporter [Sphingomonas baiyangensis]TKD51309.1 QacE family quaternary ammonium compound efflux SMR transporter [Sphingomonas baiyangensis]